MFHALASLNWAGLVLLLLLWMVMVTVALWMLDRLFPRIERSSGDGQDPPPMRGWMRPQPRPEQVRRRSLAAEAAITARPRTYNLDEIAVQPTPMWLVAYWRSSRWVLALLLGSGFVSLVLAIGLAPVFNRVRILTGFPLGYYMVAQGALVLFLLLAGIYIWRMRRLDRQYRFISPPLRADERAQRNNLYRLTGGLGLGVLLFTGGLIVCEWLFALTPEVINWIFFTVTLSLYAVIGARLRAHTLEDYYVAGRRIPGLFNGLAIGSAWISGAAFVSMAGTLLLLGYEGVAYVTGWAGGFVLLLVLFAPYLRKSGNYTVADFIGTRYGGTLIRITAAVISIVISFTYMTAQVIGIGIILSVFLQVSYTAGVTIGLGVVLLCALPGGMKGITWTQVTQSIVIMIAFLLPVSWLAFRLTGSPIAALAYGEALDGITTIEAVRGILKPYVAPFNDWSSWNFAALVICLMLGTASMPHILIRCYTAPTVRESRNSGGWALVCICAVYLTAPAYAAFVRWEMLQNVVGQAVTALPPWAQQGIEMDLLTIGDAPEAGGNGDGLVQFAELSINEDLVMLAASDIGQMPATIGALVAAGGLAAALSTASGLLLVIASSAVHDIYYCSINRRALPRERLFLLYGAMLAVAVLVALAALPRLAIIVQFVAWAFSFTAATFFPVLVLGIFWKRANRRGAVAGIVSGMVVTTSYMVLNYVNPEISVLGITHIAAGIFGAPVNFLVTWGVSHLTAPPPAPIQILVDDLRHP